MIERKSTQWILFCTAIIGVVAIPFFYTIYYLTLYGLLVLFTVPLTVIRIIWDDKCEARFYRRWYKARKRGFWRNVCLEGMRILTYNSNSGRHDAIYCLWT
ncbi:hypothetical protein [Pontibacillus yanchengensis]|uniref:Uncharacterized protein n=1 Tax=Pontibacillus yanchengensis Y32 TaxID=1385514 RepID=A0A0A2TGC5_9BACI|nr:hypothetical protein [Pontibacillus yanchengensis]KGP73468.1 hypothetical protein N782_05160 [Pontibacillus yanchengensis Y32]